MTILFGFKQSLIKHFKSHKNQIISLKLAYSTVKQYSIE